MRLDVKPKALLASRDERRGGRDLYCGGSLSGGHGENNRESLGGEERSGTSGCLLQDRRLRLGNQSKTFW
jgi:hypothetical protein